MNDMRYKNVVWDWNGTLLDDVKISVDTINVMLERKHLGKLTVEEYLRQYVIPQKGEPFGPTARSNDISEILFADLFEFILNYEVPRCKQHNRSGKKESEHGTDIIAYRFFADGKAPHKND